jgi:hypothetical protein
MGGQYGITVPADEVTGTAQVPWSRYLGTARWSGFFSPERSLSKPYDYCIDANMSPARQLVYFGISFTELT